MEISNLDKFIKPNKKRPAITLPPRPANLGIKQFKRENPGISKKIIKDWKRQQWQTHQANQ